ncbi:hypothetical protein CAOG_009727 [Capsaspora owczarzaki ATCC 30864]|uniref:ABC transporter domain-containing protein n=2 Tax=Capsaspora owczarzaki (strain ATCC 30864) TaxID=595528 RepID=A0A0D2UDF6_CAPO3|nr:hypothetical protein CAOG_009727 [Capsaspora owczarzaki ATCC 30864]
MREMADVVRNESLKAGLPSSLFAEELYPGPSVQTDAEVEQHIRDTTWGHHACCTAKIGKQEDPMAVLDSNFRVYGVRNLRVVDASVFPKIPGMFITVPILVTSQKASAAIDAQALDACRDSPYCMSSDDDSGLSRQNIGAIVGGILAFIGLALSLLYALSDKFRNKKKDAEVSARAQAQFEADRARQRAATKDRITLLGKEKEGAIDSDTLAINVTPAEARARVMFAELDRDNDGYIERHTLRAALSAASGIPLDEVVSDDVNKLLEDEPLAVDGKVSLQEFLRIRDRHVSITVPDSRANGSSMLFTPTDVYFENITLDYVDPKTQESNRVLHNLTGYIAPGTMTALLGSSGAGKSTMLDVLSMRKNTGNVEGRVLINGHERNSSFYKMSSYVPQEDLFLPTVTVREVVMYYATLRMPAYATPAARWRRCEMLLLESGLLEYVDSKVGGPLPGGITVRGLSGGQKRRLSMVCGLIANPAILFLDEVTSGLDALSALMVMEMIRRLATQGLTIIATIHQPRTSIWRMFDKVMLLANGRLMYMGDASRATEWFNSLGYPTDPQANPADFLLDLTSISFHKDPALFGNKTMRKLEHVEDAADAFAKSEHMALLRRQQKFVSYSRGVDQTLELMTRFGKDKDAKMQSSLWRRVIESSRKMAGNAEHQSMAPWGTQFGVLLKRAITNYVRNPGNVIARFVLVAFTGFMTGAAFFGLSEHWDALNSRLGALYFLCVIYVLLPFTSLSLFIYDRQFYSRESAARLYTPSAYYLANSLVELTFNAANVAISASVAYWMIDLGLSDNILGAERNANGFWVFLRIMTLLHIVGNQMVQLCGLMMPNQDMAFALGAGFVILCQIFSGFLVIPSNFNEVTEWLQYTSFLKYAYAGVVLNEFEGYDANSDPSFSIIEEAHFSNPTTVADNQYVLLGFFFVFHIMAFLCLKYLHKERR